MTPQEFRELSVGDTVFLDGTIDGKRFNRVWGVIISADTYSTDDEFDEDTEVAFLVTYNNEEDDWWVSGEYCEYVFREPRKSGLTKFLEATS